MIVLGLRDPSQAAKKRNGPFLSLAIAQTAHGMTEKMFPGKCVQFFSICQDAKLASFVEMIVNLAEIG